MGNTEQHQAHNSMWREFSVYATLISLVFNIYLIATCFGHTTIFRQTYICYIVGFYYLFHLDLTHATGWKHPRLST
jgi:hypothetical protein